MVQAESVMSSAGSRRTERAVRRRGGDGRVTSTGEEGLRVGNSFSSVLMRLIENEAERVEAVLKVENDVVVVVES